MLPRPRAKPTPKPKTKEQRAQDKLRKEKRSARIQLNRAQKKLANLDKKDQQEDEVSFVGSSAFENQEEVKEEVLFQPNEGPQTDFLASSEREVLYGGAAGGGKSYALIIDPLRYCNNQNFNALILRRTNDELRELIHKSQEMYPKAYPGAKWMEKKSRYRRINTI